MSARSIRPSVPVSVAGEREAAVLTIRAAVADDDLDAANRGNPGWMGADMMRALFASVDGAPCGMFVAELDASLVGYADWVAVGIADGHRGRATIYVLPDFRGRGVGSALWAAVLAAWPPDVVPGIRLGLDAADERSRSIATAQGLYVGGLHLESELDLDALDLEATRQLAQPPAAVSLRALSPGDDGEWIKFVDLLNEVLHDTPDHADGSEGEPPAVLRAFLPDAWQVMLACTESSIVGFTTLSVHDASGRTLYTHMTGVDHRFRGRGIATALKAAHALAVRDAGWRKIVTHNMEHNAPILASNHTLGFRRTRATQDLTYDFPPPTQGSAVGLE